MILLAVAASALAPCAPAAASRPCPMGGCDDAPGGTLTAPCCCAPSGVPAGDASKPMLKTAEAVPAAFCAVTTGSPADGVPAPCPWPDPVVSHVPLFLLHASLLM